MPNGGILLVEDIEDTRVREKSCLQLESSAVLVPVGKDFHIVTSFSQGRGDIIRQSIGLLHRIDEIRGTDQQTMITHDQTRFHRAIVFVQFHTAAMRCMSALGTFQVRIITEKEG